MSATVEQRLVSHAAALAAVKAAVDYAAQRDWAVAVAVLDSQGRLRAFAQMDGALLVAESGAQGKARAALVGLSSAGLGAALADDAVALSAFSNLPDTVLLGGGLPIEIDGRVVGAIGVGGASSQDEDEACAAAGRDIIYNMN